MESAQFFAVHRCAAALRQRTDQGIPAAVSRTRRSFFVRGIPGSGMRAALIWLSDGFRKSSRRSTTFDHAGHSPLLLDRYSSVSKSYLHTAARDDKVRGTACCAHYAAAVFHSRSRHDIPGRVNGEFLPLLELLSCSSSTMMRTEIFERTQKCGTACRPTTRASAVRTPQPFALPLDNRFRADCSHGDASKLATEPGAAFDGRSMTSGRFRHEYMDGLRAPAFLHGTHVHFGFPLAVYGRCSSSNPNSPVRSGARPLQRISCSVLIHDGVRIRHRMGLQPGRSLFQAF